MGAISNFGWPSTLSDKAWTTILQDQNFLDRYISINTQRLTNTYARCKEILNKHGIKYDKHGNAALFLWLDLREYLPPATDGWNAEAQLADKLVDAGVYLAAGADYMSEAPGFFRVVFSMDNVELGLQR